MLPQAEHPHYFSGTCYNISLPVSVDERTFSFIYSFMKKLFSTATLCLLAASAYAQITIKAGTVQLGGGVGYSQQSSDNPQSFYTGSGYVNTTQHTSTKYFSISPAAGYFVADNLAIGINLSHNTNKSAYSYDTNYMAGNEQRTSQFSVGAFMQYYRMFTEQFGVVGTLNASYNHITQRSSSSNSFSERKGNGFLTALIPSIVFFPVPKFAIGASIGGIEYGYATSKSTESSVGFNDGTSTGSSFGTNFGLSYLAFSGTYYIGR
jgi:hypothetical protein